MSQPATIPLLNAQAIIDLPPADKKGYIASLANLFAQLNLEVPPTRTETTLLSLLNHQQLQNDTLATTLATIASSQLSPHTLPKLKDLDTFSGNKNEIRDWITSMRVRLEWDGLKQAVDSTRVAYIASFLRGTPQTYFNNAFAAKTRPDYILSADALLKQLDRHFGDPNAKPKAARRSRKGARQGQQVHGSRQA